MSDRTYSSLDDWLDEIENYSLRRERVPEGAMPWIKEAWRVATEVRKAMSEMDHDRLPATTDCRSSETRDRFAKTPHQPQTAKD